MTGIGPVAVQQPRVRDRGTRAVDPERIRFTSAILPPYARRTRSLDVLLPILYLRGISTGDFAETLTTLFGKDAPGLSASTISRLKEAWTHEHTLWKKRDLSARRYVYVWLRRCRTLCRVPSHSPAPLRAKPNAARMTDPDQSAVGSVR
jgi:hypothetical protein